MSLAGTYGIILDESTFKDLLNSHAMPQASAVSTTRTAFIFCLASTFWLEFDFALCL